MDNCFIDYILSSDDDCEDDTGGRKVGENAEVSMDDDINNSCEITVGRVSPGKKSMVDKSEESEVESKSDSEEIELDINSFKDRTHSQTMEYDEKLHSFPMLGLGNWLCKQLKELSIKHPTPVQMCCIPKIITGCDVLGCAKTGTGKTLAFALPILHRLAMDPYGIFALVLTPTRELAFQIMDQFLVFGAQINCKITVIVGGRDQVAQAKDLTQRPHIVVSTPGRLADHIESNGDLISNLFRKIQFLVLDEADRLLGGQYSAELKTIFQTLPKKRQTLLFSATITSALNKLHQVSIKKPYFFEDKSDVATVDKLDQKFILCPQAVKDAYLVYVVKNFYENKRESSILIFCQTCRECQALAIMFNGLGFLVGSLHSQISQKDRLSSLLRFKSRKIRILICTDVAARGLDIFHVDLVVNHNVPRNPETYIHRVGRSARAGRFGGAVTFLTQYDLVLLQEVEKRIGKRLEKLNVSDEKVTQYVTQVLVIKREAQLKLDQQCFGEKKEINRRKQLILAGIHPDEVDDALKSQREKRSKTIKKKERMDVALDETRAAKGSRIHTILPAKNDENLWSHNGILQT